MPAFIPRSTPAPQSSGVRRSAGSRALELIDGILDAAKAQGLIRPDVTAQDLRILLGGCTRQLTAMNNRDPILWRRFGEFVLNALRK